MPSSFIATRFGIDYARLRTADGKTVDVPVQRGRDLPRPDEPNAIEILSGLKAGDRIVRSESPARGETLSNAGTAVRP